MTSKSSYHETKIIAQDEDGIRADKWLQRHFPHLSFVMLQKFFRKKQIRLDKKPVKASDRVSAGDVISFPIALSQDNNTENGDPANSQLQAQNIKLAKQLLANAIYEDDLLLVFNKPADIAVQGGSKQKISIDSALMAYCRDMPNEKRYRLVHRLDLATSGILVIAKGASSAATLTELFRNHQVEKTYDALVVGTTNRNKGDIKLAVARQNDNAGRGGDDGGKDHTKHAPKDAPKEAPKDAHSRFIVEARRKIRYYDLKSKKQHKDYISWLKLQPITGRTHQLRIHCSMLDMPIIGDSKYGYERAMISFGDGYAKLDSGRKSKKLYLHASEIVIHHPDYANSLQFSAPIPDYMQKVIDLVVG